VLLILSFTTFTTAFSSEEDDFVVEVGAITRLLTPSCLRALLADCSIELSDTVRKDFSPRRASSPVVIPKNAAPATTPKHAASPTNFAAFLKKPLFFLAGLSS
jgi:hypothetical protein